MIFRLVVQKMREQSGKGLGMRNRRVPGLQRHDEGMKKAAQTLMVVAWLRQGQEAMELEHHRVQILDLLKYRRTMMRKSHRIQSQTKNLTCLKGHIHALVVMK